MGKKARGGFFEAAARLRVAGRRNRGRAAAPEIRESRPLVGVKGGTRRGCEGKFNGTRPLVGRSVGGVYIEFDYFIVYLD